ncbi:MAG: DUF2461 domain-containing protein [Bacteroidota bacterium]
MSFFKKEFIDFFIELAPNNNKDWFDLNRKRYENFVKKPFSDFVQHLISEVTKTDKRYVDLLAKDCIFRINRDIRFSKEKSPYKLMVSAVVAPNGKKSKAVNGVYFELTPEHVRVYGGVYEIEKEDLLIVREGIARNPQKFKDVYTSKKFVDTFGEIRGEKNKIIPKELKEAGEIEPLIFNKQWYFFAEFPVDTILSADLDKIILDCYEAGKPMENYFNELINRK